MFASPAMSECVEIVGRVIPSDVTVLLRSDSDTKKKIPGASPVRETPMLFPFFVVVNCDAIPLDLHESKLFGPVRVRSPGPCAKSRDTLGVQHATPFFDEVSGGRDSRACFVQIRVPSWSSI